MSEMTNSNEPAATETPTAPEANKGRKRKKSGDAKRGPETSSTRGSGANRGSSRRATTDVRGLTTVAIAAPFYGLMIWGAKMAPPGARALLLERGWPPHATMILTAVALAILLVKAVGLGRQRRAFGLDLLPDTGSRIGPEIAARLVAHVESMRSARGGRSFLVERVLRVLSQYAAHGDVAEANAANDADADADASSVAASFSTVKVLVWAMPILGLIGTVVGLSGAVGAFSHAMSGADQLDTIKDSLREVTTGLAVAFDATFVALLASILVMLPMTWLQKAEDKLVNDVDDYCVTHILARLGGSAQPAVASAEQAPADIKAMVVDALAQPLAEMLSANAKLMERMAEERAALADAQGALAAQLSSFAATLQQAMPAMVRAAGQLEQATAEIGPSVAQMGSIGPSVQRALVELEKSSAAVGPSMERAAGQIERAVTQLEQVQDRVAPSVERAAGQIERAVTQLEATTAMADQAATAAERAQDQLSRELGASRQLLSLLAAGLGANDASLVKPRHANGTNGANGTSAARGG